MSLTSSSTKRKRAPAACKLCRKRHVRCTWSMPDGPTPCKRCRERKLNCVYEPTNPLVAQPISPVMPRSRSAASSDYPLHSSMPISSRPRAVSDSFWYPSPASSSYSILSEHNIGNPPALWSYSSSSMASPPPRLSPVISTSYNYPQPYVRHDNAPRSPLTTPHPFQYDPCLAASQASMIYPSPIDTQWPATPYLGSDRSSFGVDPNRVSHSPVYFNDSILGLYPPSRM